MLTRFFSASLTMPIAPPIVTPIALLSILLSIILAMTTSVSRAAEYIEPDHTTELFQLEKIPLPQHRMQQLGKSLIIIALRKHDGSPTFGAAGILAGKYSPASAKNKRHQRRVARNCPYHEHTKGSYNFGTKPTR